MKTGKRVEQISLTNQISIDNFSEKHAGLYECRVTNEIFVKSQNGGNNEEKIHVFDNTYAVNITVAGKLINRI